MVVGDLGGQVPQAADPVPFRLRIGVTGHRQLPEGIDWRERIAEALGLIEALLSPAGDTPLAWLAISSLAEGADRLVAEVILARPGSLLEVPLPLPRDDYQTDFESDESRAAFARLYEQASVITCAPCFESRDSAYEWAGLAMVGRSDIVIAVWDGLPSRGVGGTADIVNLARRYGRPVVHVPIGSDQEIQVLHPFAEDEPSRSSACAGQGSSGGDTQSPERVSPVDPFTNLRRALRGMEAYNRIDVGADSLATASEQARADLMKCITPDGRAIWEPVASWLIPYYATADFLAKAARGRVKWLLAITFTFPVLAIATVAVQSQFLPTFRGLLWAEVVFLLAVPLVMGMDRIARFHPDRAEKRIRRRRLPMSAQQQWVTCRHLAERLRSAFFLAAVEPPARRTAEESSEAERNYSGLEANDFQPLEVNAAPIQIFLESAEDWPSRFYAEIWLRRQCTPITDSDLPLLRHVLAEQWIRGQESYHFKAAARNRRNDYLTTTAIITIFILTAVVAALHATGVGDRSSSVGETLILIAITFPALAAVVTTLTHHFEFRRHRETSESMKRRLEYAAEVVARAPTLHELRREAEATERLMMTENREWFTLMRLHELELHA
jgi:hypothetical protein